MFLKYHKENINNEKLRILKDNIDHFYPLIGKLKDFKNYTDITNKTTIKTLLENYYLKSQKNENRIEYKSVTKTNQGRLFANPSLQSMSKVIRHTILLPGHLDYDFENCHYQILEQTLHKLKINCPELSNYNKNRDKIYSDYIKKNNIH